MSTFQMLLTVFCLMAMSRVHTDNFALFLCRLVCTSSVIARKLDSHAHPPYKLPSSKNNRWVERKPFNKMYEYTTDPLPFPKTGGRGPNGRCCYID